MARSTQASRSAKDAKTQSERSLEDYFDRQGVAFEHEPPIPGKSRRPDYRVTWNGCTLFCEVKGLLAKRPLPKGGVHSDPYAGIRKKIHEATKQFKEYRDSCCVLVIHNVDDWEFRDWPSVLFGAMLGNLGLRIPFDPRRGIALTDGAQLAFLDQGKMIDPKGGRIQNTTISAIVVLSDFSIPNPAFEKEYENRIGARKRELSRELTTVEHLEIRTALYAEMPVVLGHCPRVTLFENPFARRTLPQGVFEGRYDARHRFNLKLGRIERVFAGKGLAEAEQLRQNGRDIAQKIEAFRQAVIEHFAPERIVLFGSHAYGCPEPGSDVDLLVIFPGNGSAADRSLEIRKKLIPDFPLDLITRSTGEIEDRLKLGDSFLREILSRGKTLYESAHT